MKACVISVSKTGIKVRLESGLVANVSYAKNTNVGQEVIVGCNLKHIIEPHKYTIFEPAKIDEDGEDNEIENPEEIELELSTKGGNYEQENNGNGNNDSYSSNICYFDKRSSR